MEKHIKCKQITKTAATTQHDAAGLSSARLLSFRLCLMRFAYSSHVIGKELYTHLMPSSGPIAIQPRQWAPCSQQGESHFYCQPLLANQCWKFEAIPSGMEERPSNQQVSLYCQEELHQTNFIRADLMICHPCHELTTCDNILMFQNCIIQCIVPQSLRVRQFRRFTTIIKTLNIAVFTSLQQFGGQKLCRTWARLWLNLRYRLLCLAVLGNEEQLIFICI